MIKDKVNLEDAEPVIIKNGMRTDASFHEPLLKNKDAADESDLLTLSEALNQGYKFEDAVKSFVSSASLRKELLDIHHAKAPVK